MLIVRDLLLGPLRYKDLLDGLQGIGTNLLAARLHHLESIGLIEKATLPPPGGSSVYQLTEDGRDLEPAIAALARWGSRLFGRSEEADRHTPAWVVLGLAFMADSERTFGLRDVYDMELDGERFLIRAEAGSVKAERGIASTADVEIETTVASLRSLRLGETRASAEGVISISGDSAAVERCAQVLRLPWLTEATAQEIAV